ETFWPSCIISKPPAVTAEQWKKRSFPPPSGGMKPNPRSRRLLIVRVAMTVLLSDRPPAMGEPVHYPGNPCGCPVLANPIRFPQKRWRQSHGIVRRKHERRPEFPSGAQFLRCDLRGC